MARSRAEVAVGDTFGPVTVPVSRAGLVDYANASGDQNPIHQDEAFALSVGLPSIIAHGMWTMGAAGAVLDDWVGAGGRVLEFGTRFTKPVVVPADGATLEVGGEVTALDDQGRVTVTMTTTADGAKVLGRCVATVQLD